MIRKYLEQHPKYRKLFEVLYRVLPGIIFLSYAAMILWLLINRDVRVWKVIEVPFIVFAGTTVIRKLINAPRPYEVTGISPLIKKDKKGQSFPSRHVVSAVIISVAGFYLNLWIGSILLVISLGIAACRVISGVHFVKDVAAGFVISIIAGMIGFFV